MLKKIALTVSLLLPFTLSAFSVQISPTKLNIDQTHKVGIIKLKNLSGKDSMVKISLYRWSQDDTGKSISTKVDKSEKFIITPKIFKLQARQSKAIRITKIVRSKKDHKQRFYRVVIKEIPTEVGLIGLPALFGIDLPMVLNESVEKGSLIEVSHSGTSIKIKTGSEKIVKISTVKFLDKDGSLIYKRDVSQYVLPGKTIEVDFNKEKKDGIHKIILGYDSGSKEIIL